MVANGSLRGSSRATRRAAAAAAIAGGGHRLNAAENGSGSLLLDSAIQEGKSGKAACGNGWPLNKKLAEGSGATSTGTTEQVDYLGLTL